MHRFRKKIFVFIDPIFYQKPIRNHCITTNRSLPPPSHALSPPPRYADWGFKLIWRRHYTTTMKKKRLWVWIDSTQLQEKMLMAFHFTCLLPLQAWTIQPAAKCLRKRSSCSLLLKRLHQLPELLNTVLKITTITQPGQYVSLRRVFW